MTSDIDKERANTMAEQWRLPATIHNIVGTRIVCLLKNGRLRLDTVVKDGGGLCSLAATPIAEVAGWRPHTPRTF